jgi:hypothetical protein
VPHADVQKAGKERRQFEVVSLGYAAGAKSPTGSYMHSRMFGTHICTDPALRHHDEKLSFKQYKNLIVRTMTEEELLLSMGWQYEEMPRLDVASAHWKVQLIANTICPNPFEAFMAAILKAIGITAPHDELMCAQQSNQSHHYKSSTSKYSHSRGSIS